MSVNFTVTQRGGDPVPPFFVFSLPRYRTLSLMPGSVGSQSHIHDFVGASENDISYGMCCHTLFQNVAAQTRLQTCLSPLFVLKRSAKISYPFDCRTSSVGPTGSLLMWIVEQPD